MPLEYADNYRPRGTDLQGTNLEDAISITIEELEKQAKSLQGATMPMGQSIPSENGDLVQRMGKVCVKRVLARFRALPLPGC